MSVKFILNNLVGNVIVLQVLAYSLVYPVHNVIIESKFLL